MFTMGVIIYWTFNIKLYECVWFQQDLFPKEIGLASVFSVWFTSFSFLVNAKATRKYTVSFFYKGLVKPAI